MDENENEVTVVQRTRRRAASRPAGPPEGSPGDAGTSEGASAVTAAPRKRATKKAAAKPDAPTAEEAGVTVTTTRRTRKTASSAKSEEASAEATTPVKRTSRVKASEKPADADASAPSKPAAKKAAKRTSKAPLAATFSAEPDLSAATTAGSEQESTKAAKATAAPKAPKARPAATTALFVAPDLESAPKRRPTKKAATSSDDSDANESESTETGPRGGQKSGQKSGQRKQSGRNRPESDTDEPENDDESGFDGEPDEDEEGGARRRRRRGGRRRRKPEDEASESGSEELSEDEESDAGDSDDDSEGSASSRRRRRRRRRGSSGGDDSSDDPPNTVVRVREARDEVTAVKGSTRLEAKRQRRREGREAGRRRAPIVTEAEFLARRESIERIMAVRQDGDLTQVAVIEDSILVEHYVAKEPKGNQVNHGSMLGNIYLGRVQNVLPSMEAAFVDIGRGRNAVLYAGEVNWNAHGLEGQPKRIEDALKSGDTVLVQVTKDPVGQKGARLTSQISLPGRYVVYVPDGSMTGISRKLPERERGRLKSVLRSVLPEDSGVIVRTAAEGASEEELQNDVTRLMAAWEEIKKKASSGKAPRTLYGEPPLAIRIVRDIFNEDFAQLVVSGDEAWGELEEYVGFLGVDLQERLKRWSGSKDLFAHYRVDEQLAKGLDRKVWLPSGGSLVIDRTEAMTVVDVNTGKFTGEGGNLEETVTRNNLEAAEEVVRQLRLRDIGGIIVIDFIDMVLESNRDLVVRRLVECLARDRTKHQVAEVTSLGLVQMTRKRIGQGLLETFSEPCEHCAGRGVKVNLHPHEPEAKSVKRPKVTGYIPGAPVPGGSDDEGLDGQAESDAADLTLELEAAGPETTELVLEPEAAELVLEPEATELELEPETTEPEATELVVEPETTEPVLEPEATEPEAALDAESPGDTED